MANVSLPTSVLVAGGALCCAAGFLAGYVITPDPPDHTTATVASFDAATGRLCLKGKGLEDLSGVDSDGRLCGRWQRSQSSRRPAEGERFRFVTVRTDTSSGKGKQTLIYGSVVG